MIGQKGYDDVIMMSVNHRYKQEVLQKHKEHERRLGLLIGLELVFRLRVRVRVYEASVNLRRP